VGVFFYLAPCWLLVIANAALPSARASTGGDGDIDQVKEAEYPQVKKRGK
jgi:hypothetical protein